MEGEWNEQMSDKREKRLRTRMWLEYQLDAMSTNTYSQEHDYLEWT